MNRRGRVPFALIGVLLLAGSGTLAASVQDPVVTEPAVDAGLERLAVEVHTALRAAVREAARDAARDPVVVPANSTAGRALSGSQPFEDALRLRIYVAARDHLGRLAARRRGVALRATLPPVRDVRAAIERVHFERAGERGRAVSVRIDGVRLRARSGERVVGERRLEPDLVVETPVLSLHDRVEEFERRLNAPVGAPGLGTRLTAALYPIAWARGYAQFRGGAVENVVANRHVELVTNRAVLAAQRASFGASDPLGRRVYRRTVVETAVTELVRATNWTTLERLDRLASATGLRESSGDTLDRLEPGRGTPRPSDPVTVAVNRTADLAYARAARGLNQTLAATYSPAGRVRADVRTLGRERVDSHDPPPDAGGVLDVYTYYSTTVRAGSRLPPRTAEGWHRLANYSRTVTVEERTVKLWSMPGNGTAATTGTVLVEKAVGLAVEGDHVVGPAPERPIPSVHRPGGPLDGQNLADAPTLITDRLVDGRGGPEALAARAALGRLDTEPVPVEAARPDGILAWTHPDLSALHDEVRQIAVEVPRGEIATLEANVPSRLAAKLRERRAELVDAPRTYGSVAERARVGVRAAYVDRVVAMLEARADQHHSGRSRLAEAFPSAAADPAELLRAGYEARGYPDPPGKASPVRLRVDASPSYLPVEAVGHGTVPAIPAGRREHPLVARNVNAFSLPTRDVVDFLFGLLEGPDTTSLRSAARVLTVAADVGLDRTSPFRPAAVLGTQVSRSAELVEAALVRVLARHDFGSKSAREAVVERALGRWEAAGPRGAAISNGSAAEAVYERAVDRWPRALETAHERKLLATELDFAVETATAEEFTQPRTATVNRTATRLRGLLGAVDARGRSRPVDRAQAIAERRAASIAARLPAGVPVVPAPGMWYATVNAWHVQVRGSYAHFAVRAPTGAPDRVPPDLSYVRESETVRLDVDGDGRAERLGANRRIDFASETVVAVAVPPQPQGVGDVTERDERSPGWPRPGPAK